jgi:hypothetical protein
MAVASEQASVSGPVVGDQPHFTDPLAILGQKQLIRHRHAELLALHGLRAFISGFQLRIHPLVSQETGTILGDAVAAH